MSFIACDKNGNLVMSENINLNNYKNTFYCPNPDCKCLYSCRSVYSNKRKPHFFKLKSSNHIDGCWGILVDSVSNDIGDYDLSDFSANGLLESVISTRRSKNTQPNDSMNKGIGTRFIHTIRQLKDYCLAFDNNTVLNNDITIKDIFCGRKTSFLYTKYIKGIKLVECQYHYYKKEKQSIFFTFPYKSNPIIKIQLVFDSVNLFWEMVKYFNNNKDKIVFILADFINTSSVTYAHISSKKQILVLWLYFTNILYTFLYLINLSSVSYTLF